MSDYGTFMKSLAKKDADFFFGEGNKTMVSNKYFTFKHVLDNDNIIINTNNIKKIKGNYVMVIGNSDAIYLKSWQIKCVHNWNDIGCNLYLVKLSRKYFKPYHFSFSFDDLFFDEKVQDFDCLLEIAKSQDIANMSVANGFMG